MFSRNYLFIFSLVPREDHVLIKFIHDAPSYVGEFYQILVELTNSEEYEITDVW